MLVGRRALPALLALVAAIADARGAHGLAFDALPLRRPASIEALARSAGLGEVELLSALGTLELRELAQNRSGQWIKATRLSGHKG